MSEIHYTVGCSFTDPAVAERWLAWLRDEHLADVCAGGATAAQVVAMDGDDIAYEVRYRFPSRQAFQAYERDHAPRLRTEGLERFPLSLGLTYRRTVGEATIIHP